MLYGWIMSIVCSFTTFTWQGVSHTLLCNTKFLTEPLNYIFFPLFLLMVQKDTEIKTYTVVLDLNTDIFYG